MEKRIRKLEKESRRLEISERKRSSMLEKAGRYGEDFLNEISEKPAFENFNNTESILHNLSFEEEGKPFTKLLNVLDSEVDSKGLNPASGKHGGYIPGGGIYPSAIADYLSAITNRYAGVFFSSPGAVRMENQCIRWMCDLVGYPETAAGNLTSGGSIANLIGMVTARDNFGIQAKDFGQAVIYTTHQVHHCVIKAIKFAGLREAEVRNIEMDDRFRMKPKELARQIPEDKKEGLIPLMIFASAGTTDLGAVDPLDEIADIAQEHNLWFHVDAAYGGFFLLTEHGKKVMTGIEHSDSVTIDPHKGLFLPYGTGALLVKEGKKLFESQHMMANYMQDTLKATEEWSPADLSPELSKHFRGLRMWLPLQLLGISPFRAALEEKLLLTRYFYKEIQKIENIEVGPEPELSILFFRYIPDTDTANDFNKKLVDFIHRDGRVFLSSTHINGTVYLRLAVLHFRTHLEEIDLILSVIREGITKIVSSD
jgi:glutamate/tyrosine decarboxylase-like PLP-dependent enzyme